jgi:transposase
MEAIIERCCGLDVHKDIVVACVLIGPEDGKARKEIRTYGTTTGQLEQLRDWLHQARCTHVGMESTGVYWVPVYAVLEDHFELIVGNAAHTKNVPGRKTDVKDAQWIAELIRCGRPQELCTAEVATRAARPDAVSTQARRSTGERTQSAAAPVGDLQREAGVSGHRRVR